MLAGADVLLLLRLGLFLCVEVKALCFLPCVSGTASWRQGKIGTWGSPLVTVNL